MKNNCDLAFFDKFFEENKQRFFKEWSEYLRFKSVSGIPAMHGECRKCASWLVDHLKKIGLKAEIWETSDKTLPVVYGEFKGSGGISTLVYGHYDVQPAEPLEKWESPAFEPTWRDGRLYARGAQDNKGQNFALIKAIETLNSLGILKCPIKITIEGEEEKGSAGMMLAVDSWATKLSSSVLLVCDTHMAETGNPLVTVGLRGMIDFEFKLTGPKTDVHSGNHGGLIKNPAVELAKIVASLHNAEGTVTVPGFYEGVEEPTKADLEMLKKRGFDEKDLQHQVGVPANGGESKYPPLVRLGFRPTLEVNGMWSGWTGPGPKSIIPAEASVKITTRIVRGQDPKKLQQKVEKYFLSKIPQGMKMEVISSDVHGPAFLQNADDPVIEFAKPILEEVLQKPMLLEWCGASIPMIAVLADKIGTAPLLAGFDLEADNMHAPNESFSERQFKLNFLYGCRILQKLSEGDEGVLSKK